MENGAAGTPDYPALREAAHSLKSSSANLGAMSLSAAAKRIEMGARQQSLERPAVAVALVANEFHRVRQQLRATQRSEADSLCLAATLDSCRSGIRPRRPFTAL